MTEGKHVGVIGGGLAGLTSALLLARNGYTVTLVEKSRQVGLTLRGFYRQGTYFDTGLHYTGGLAENGIVSRYLRYLGFDALELVAFDDAGFDEIYFEDTGKRVRLPVGYERITASLQADFPEEAEAVAAYMQAARDGFASSSLLRFFMDAKGGMEALQAQSGCSLKEYLDTITDTPHLRATLAIHSLLYGCSPAETPFVQHSYVAASYYDSVHNFVGGGGALIKAFEQRLAEEGVTVITGNGVRRIVCDGKRRVTGLELEDGETIPVEGCICTAHPASLAMMAGDLFRPAYLKWLRGLEDTASAYMFFGIAETRPDCLRGRNLFLCRGPELENAFGGRMTPEHGPFYVATSPQPDPKAKAGIVVVAPGSFSHVAQWADSSRGKRPAAYVAYKEGVATRVRDSLVRLCPELEAVRFVEAATPLTMRDYLDAPQGGLYGCKHTVAHFNPLPVTRSPNLWLAGQSVIAPGLMGAMISGFLACGFLLGHSTLQREMTCL